MATAAKTTVSVRNAARKSAFPRHKVAVSRIAAAAAARPCADVKTTSSSLVSVAGEVTNKQLKKPRFEMKKAAWRPAGGNAQTPADFAKRRTDTAVIAAGNSRGLSIASPAGASRMQPVLRAIRVPPLPTVQQQALQQQGRYALASSIDFTATTTATATITTTSASVPDAASDAASIPATTATQTDIDSAATRIETPACKAARAAAGAPLRAFSPIVPPMFAGVAATAAAAAAAAATAAAASSSPASAASSASSSRCCSPFRSAITSSTTSSDSDSDVGSGRSTRSGFRSSCSRSRPTGVNMAVMLGLMFGGRHRVVMYDMSPAASLASSCASLLLGPMADDDKDVEEEGEC